MVGDQRDMWRDQRNAQTIHVYRFDEAATAHSSASHNGQEQQQAEGSNKQSAQEDRQQERMSKWQRDT